MENELYHHGIRGQKWGVRNGPPYPLGSDQRSSEERKLNPKSGSGPDESWGTRNSKKSRQAKKEIKMLKRQMENIYDGSPETRQNINLYNDLAKQKKELSKQLFGEDYRNNPGYRKLMKTSEYSNFDYSDGYWKDAGIAKETLSLGYDYLNNSWGSRNSKKSRQVKKEIQMLKRQMENIYDGSPETKQYRNLYNDLAKRKKEVSKQLFGEDYRNNPGYKKLMKTSEYGLQFDSSDGYWKDEGIRKSLITYGSDFASSFGVRNGFFKKNVSFDRAHVDSMYQMAKYMTPTSWSGTMNDTISEYFNDRETFNRKNQDAAKSAFGMDYNDILKRR